MYIFFSEIIRTMASTNASNRTVSYFRTSKNVEFLRNTSDNDSNKLMKEIQKRNNFIYKQLPFQGDLVSCKLFQFLFEFNHRKESLQDQFKNINQIYFMDKTFNCLSTNTIIHSLPFQLIKQTIKEVWNEINSDKYLKKVESLNLSNKEVGYHWFTMCVSFISFLINHSHLCELTNTLILSFVSQLIIYVDIDYINLKKILNNLIETSQFAEFSFVEFYIDIHDVEIIEIFLNFPIQNLMITSKHLQFVPVDKILCNFLGFPKITNVDIVNLNDEEKNKLNYLEAPKKFKKLIKSLKKISFAPLPITEQSDLMKLYIMSRSFTKLLRIAFTEHYYEPGINFFKKSNLPSSMMIRNRNIIHNEDFNMLSLFSKKPGTESVIIFGENFRQFMETNYYCSKLSSYFYNQRIKDTALTNFCRSFPEIKQINIQVINNANYFTNLKFELLKKINISPSTYYKTKIIEVLQNFICLKDQLTVLEIEHFIIDNLNNFVKIISQFKNLEKINLINSIVTSNCKNDSKELFQIEHKVESLGVSLAKDNYINISTLINYIKPITFKFASIDLNENDFSELISYEGFKSMRYLKFIFRLDENSHQTLEYLKYFINLKSIKNIEIIIEDNSFGNTRYYNIFKDILNRYNKKCKLVINTNVRFYEPTIEK